MKKISSTIILSLFGFLILTASALADTTARFLPATLSTSAGQVFNVAIAIDPQGATNYAEKMEITYPADTLEVENFVPASNWLPLTQPGYDQLDNTNGILTKTAGYPGGFSTSTLFGIVTFEAKKLALEY